MHRVGKTFVKTTKRGQAVTKVRRERYLRDDVYVGCGDAAVEARYRGRDEALYVLRPERRGAKSERTIALMLNQTFQLCVLVKQLQWDHFYLLLAQKEKDFLSQIQELWYINPLQVFKDK